MHLWIPLLFLDNKKGKLCSLLQLARCRRALHRFSDAVKSHNLFEQIARSFKDRVKVQVAYCERAITYKEWSDFASPRLHDDAVAAPLMGDIMCLHFHSYLQFSRLRMAAQQTRESLKFAERLVWG